MYNVNYVVSLLPITQNSVVFFNLIKGVVKAHLGHSILLLSLNLVGLDGDLLLKNRFLFI